MANIIHKKINEIPDFTQADLDAQIAAGFYPHGTLLADIVLPSDWNNSHTITGTPNTLAGYNNAGASQDFTLGTGFAIVGTTLINTATSLPQVLAIQYMGI